VDSWVSEIAKLVQQVTGTRAIACKLPEFMWLQWRLRLRRALAGLRSPAVPLYSGALTEA